jgi:CRISPR system Cascade subunit CasD
MRVLLLRLRAPLMSFGAPAIDDEGPVGQWPTRSMLTGMFGCGLGWDHAQHAELTRLQNRLMYAVRCDREPSSLVDLQTVMVGHPEMAYGQITPDGWVAYRDDQWLKRKKLVMRRREYLVDGEFIVAVTLANDGEVPTVDDIAHKMDHPEAAICIGRRPCIPSTRLVVKIVEVASLLDALKTEPTRDGRASLRATWPESEGPGRKSRVVEIIEDRDWRNCIHVGRRRMLVGRIEVPSCLT